MSIKKILSAALIACSFLISVPVLAQFEGHVTIKIYNDDNKNNKDEDYINLYATSDRILIKGDNNYSFMDGAYDASGLLIRNDVEDFILMTGENEALQFTKSELEGFFDMISGFTGDDPSTNIEVDEYDASFVYTNSTRSIKGYDCTELRIINDENDNYLSVWLTSGVDINWGMLEKPWKNVPGEMKEPAQRLTQEFKSRNFPMMVEVYEDGVTTKVMEVTNVNKSAVAKAMVEIPSNIELVGIGDILFKMMMKSNR